MYHLTNNGKNKYADLCNDSGVAKCKRGYLLSGIDDFNQGIHSDPKHFYAHLNRASAHRELGMFVFAEADLKKAAAILNEDLRNLTRFTPEYLISQHSAYTDLYNNSGVAKCEHGNIVTGIMDFDTAIMFDPNNTLAYYNRGLAKKQIGLNNSGNADWQKVREIYNRNTNPLWYLPS